MDFFDNYQQMVRDLAAPVEDAMKRIMAFDENTKNALEQTLFELQSMENNIDGFKKKIYYGKDFQPDLILAEIPDELRLPLSRIAGDPVRVQLFHAVLGIASESIELLKAILAEDLDLTNVAEELGDTAWYVTLGADACGTGLGTVLESNMKKLRNRYGARWTQKAAIHRNLAAERQVLEQSLEAGGEK